MIVQKFRVPSYAILSGLSYAVTQPAYHWRLLVQDVVYAFKPEQSIAVSISLCGSVYDTVLALYGRADDWSAVEEISCNDDYCGPQSYLAVRPMHCWRPQAEHSHAVSYES